MLGSPDSPLSICQGINECTLEIALPSPQGIHPRVIAFDIEGEPDIEPGILQQGDGSVVLNAAMADIHKSEASALSITPTGIVNSWYNPDDWLEWEFKNAAGGEFVVEVTTASIEHGQSWQGGHEVEISLDNSCPLQSKLELDHMVDDVSTRYYPQGVSICGKLNIPATGTHRLSLRASKILQETGSGLNIASIRLIPNT